MNFDARKSYTPEDRYAYIEWLVGETTGALRRGGTDHESLKASVFLAMNRAREAGLSDREVAEVLGVSIARSGMHEKTERMVLDFAEGFDSLSKAVYAEPPARKPWWRLGR